MEDNYMDEYKIVRDEELEQFLVQNVQLLCEGKISEVEKNIRYIESERSGLGFSECMSKLKRYLLEMLIEKEEIDALVTMIEPMEMEEILYEIEANQYPVLKRVVERLDWSIWLDFDANSEFVKWMQVVCGGM